MANLPKIAMQRLHQKSAAGVHPDSNLISAFAENALPHDARAQILEHMAQCADCREVIFLSSPEQAATLSAPVATPSTWLTWPALRWGAAVAAVVVVVGAVTLHRQSGRNVVLPGAIQMTDAPIAKEKAASVSLSEEKRDVAIMAKPVAVPPQTKNELVGKSEGTRSEPFKKQMSKLAASPMLAQKSGIAAGRLADKRSDELDKTTVEVAGAADAVPLEADQVVPGRAKDAAASPASNMGAAAVGGAGPSAARGVQPRTAMFSAMIAPRWTLTSDGTLQRSLNFGRSWEIVQVATQASFRALAASGKDIWVGGSKGALYHSTDAGQSWTQVQPASSGQALSDDIIGVEFPDTLHGKLTTSNKQTWITEDGGQSWRKQ